ncbi:hypothetical protein [Phytohabitans rumicis]|uniref:Uncharacterized protein n=1 Tax=Phytohabitans rumicis TaxID=1076125 RepID=A0A6V8KMW4_9ACTN|nr:hypothetical protein [Phytohabitans rumicis]GFJ86493.1 hypothetical protein Prum_001350 [Phytohabitans rumicis]
MGELTTERFAELRQRSSLLVAGLLVFPRLDGDLDAKRELIGAGQAFALIQRGHLRFAGVADAPMVARAEVPPDEELRPEEALLVDELCPTAEPAPFPRYGPILARLGPVIESRAHAEGLLRRPAIGLLAGRFGRTRAGNQLAGDLLALRDDLRSYAAGGDPARIEPAAQAAAQPYAIMLGVRVM